jgi:DNA-binding MarR family transcriptional regulator
MYDAAESLTDNKRSILVSIPTNKLKAIVAEFTMKKARQIDVVDMIFRQFKYLTDYNTSTITFPASKKKSRQKKPPAKRTVEEATLTEKQGQYLAFINTFIKSKGHSPDVTDFEKHFCVGPTSVYRILGKLEEKGFIKRIQQKPRRIELLISEDDIADLENGAAGGRRSAFIYPLL